MKKYFAILMLLAVLLPSLRFFSFSIDASAIENLGTVTECLIDRSSQTVTVRGSIKHSVLVANRESQLAVYRFDPWVDVTTELKTAEPLEVMDMTIRFEFRLPCDTISERLSMYGVAILSPNGEIKMISEPQYADYYTSDTSESGFKAVITDDVAGAVASYPGSAVVDVYLDKLDKGNKSGHIFNADGKLFYFDREVINELDKKVLSYTAAGTNVYFRFLISGNSDELPFCTSGNLWATNKCVVVSNAQALSSIYAYTNFLVSRYDGDKFGKVDGIILGRGCDMPILYNYASLVSEDYNTVYARSLALIGLAAVEAAGNRGVSLIVPVGDTLDENLKVYATDVLESIGAYFEKHTNLTFTVMCESRHNPYKLNDSDFSTEIDPDDTGEEDYWNTDDTYTEQQVAEPPESDYMIEEDMSAIATDSEETTCVDTTEDPEDTKYEESKGPIVNVDSDGYFCTDNIETFLKFFNTLKKKFSSVNDGFAWCWYPDSDTIEGALGVCYSYNYMKLASVDADFFAICFENESSGKFSSLSYLFKFIDTGFNDKETAYARSAFNISDWSELIDGYYLGLGVYHKLKEGTLLTDVTDYIGSIPYFDYTTGKGTGGWYNGLHCDSLGIQVNENEAFLQVTMDLDSVGVNQAEIGYIFDIPEPLMMGDSLVFEIECGANDGALYEVAVHIRSNDSTLVSKAVISGGVKSYLSMDVSDQKKTDGVDSMKITLKRVTGSGKCNLKLYRVLINSTTASDEQLAEELQNIREFLREDTSNADNDRRAVLVWGFAILMTVGLIAALFTWINDKKHRLSEDNNINNNNLG